MTDTDHTSQPEVGQPKAGSAPGNPDVRLEQNITDSFSQAQKQVQQAEEAEKQRIVTEAFDKVRKLGFVTADDVKEVITKKDEQINKLFSEIQQIKSYLKSVATPAQNSGLLDDPKPKQKNPLLLW